MENLSGITLLQWKLSISFILFVVYFGFGDAEGPALYVDKRKYPLNKNGGWKGKSFTTRILFDFKGKRIRGIPEFKADCYPKNEGICVFFDDSTANDSPVMGLTFLVKVNKSGIDTELLNNVDKYYQNLYVKKPKSQSNDDYSRFLNCPLDIVDCAYTSVFFSDQLPRTPIASSVISKLFISEYMYISNSSSFQEVPLASLANNYVKMGEHAKFDIYGSESIGSFNLNNYKDGTGDESIFKALHPVYLLYNKDKQTQKLLGIIYIGINYKFAENLNIWTKLETIFNLKENFTKTTMILQELFCHEKCLDIFFRQVMFYDKGERIKLEEDFIF